MKLKNISLKKLDTDQIATYLAEVLNESFHLSLDDLDKFESEGDKSMIYGLICLSEDLDFYRKSTDLKINNLKSSLFNSTAVAITDRKGVIKEVNEQFKVITGYKEEELLGNTFSMLDSGYHDESYFSEMWQTILIGKSWKGEFCNMNKSGNHYWEYAHIFPIKDELGNITEFWTIRNDITPRKKAEEALNRALEAQQLLMKEMHHRIKNNLQLLMSILQLKSKRCNDGENEIIKETVGRINAISKIHEIFYQSADGQFISLSEYLKKTFSIGQLGITNDTVILIDGEEVQISIEHCTYLGIVLNELITNSLKHAWDETSIKHSEIQISFTQEGSGLNLKYSDNGIGFDIENVDSSLGFILIELLITKQLEGSYCMEADNGFSIDISIPLNEGNE